MESLFNKNIPTQIETENILYNITNSNDPKYFFLYLIVIVGFIFISTKVTFNINILIGLLFCSFVIYYLYTYKKYNILTLEQKDKQKFNTISAKNQILAKYPDIVDLLFYMRKFNMYSTNIYKSLIGEFETFCQIYEFCLIDYNLIFKNIDILTNEKIKILNIIDSFILMCASTQYYNTLYKTKKSAENILNKMINKLILLSKKKIYYDGWDTSKSSISSNLNIIPFNTLYSLDYKEHYDKYNIADLLNF